MKLAYSILLGEHVAAVDANYGDVAAFQIVCPCCKDPVVKVERSIHSETSHFFRHHKSVPGHVDCELRVAGITNEVRAATDSIGRGQSLKVFLGVFRDLLKLARFRPERWPEGEIRPGVQKFAELLELRFLKRSILTGPDAEDLLDMHAKVGDFDALTKETGLTMAFRRRLAGDMIAHLKASHAAKSRRAAMIFAACETVVNLAVPPEKIAAGADRNTANKLMDYELEDLSRWLSGIIAGDEEHKEIVALETFALRVLTFALLTIPVRPILDNARNGRPPLHQITHMDRPEVRPDAA